MRIYKPNMSELTPDLQLKHLPHPDYDEILFESTRKSNERERESKVRIEKRERERERERRKIENETHKKRAIVNCNILMTIMMMMILICKESLITRSPLECC